MKSVFSFNPAGMLRRLAGALALTLALAAPASAAGTPPLVGVGWLHEHLRDDGLIVVDIRSAIDGGGAKAYAAAHVPGAVHSDYDKAWRVTRNNVPFLLPSVPVLERLIGELGIDDTSRVVIVPAGVHVTDFGAAARVYWTLKVAGVQAVSILDGGFAAWQQANLPVEQGVTAPSPAIFTAVIDDGLLAQLSDVEGIRRDGGATLVDARPLSHFSGKEKAANVAAYGHIPGALALDSADFYDAATNRLKPKAALEAAAARLPSGPIVSYCNTGHWAAINWFVLHELLGRREVRLYDGSMIEWAADARRPLESARTKWDDLKKTLGLGS
jgi:thiosulfate/3-mercaptopyruvate sulfurtransferase